MAEKLRIGLLGAARITPKAICQPARVMTRFDVTAVAARNKARAEAFAAEHGVKTALDGYQALVESPDVDLVYNPLPINLHAEWTIKALEAGKHVLCEKPLAMNLDEAKAMQAAADRSGKRLIEAFHYRYHPAFQQCLDWLSEGLIGEIRSIDTEFSVAIRDSDEEIRQLPETGGGAMMDLGCYPLNWVLNIIGEDPGTLEVQAAQTSRGVDEGMTVLFRQTETDRQIVIQTHMNQGRAFRAHLDIHGSRGRIRFGNPVHPHVSGSLTLSSESGDRVAEISPISTYTWQLAAISRALETGERLPTEGAIILRQQQMIDAIYETAGLRRLRYL